jgi:uncharacterized protein (TIGR02147 family)
MFSIQLNYDALRRITWPMLFESQDYRGYIKALLADRMARNPRYSMRAMAKQLGLSSTNLCEVLKGKRRFSAESAAKIGQRLELEESEQEYFNLLVQLDGSRNPALRESLLKRLSTLNPRAFKPFDLSLDVFRVIADWYHFAILEMTYLDEELNAKTVSERLGITRLEAELALERLLRLELLEESESGRYRKTQGELLAQSRTPNEALRKFSRQMLEKAIVAQETQGRDSRISATQTIPFASDALPEAEKIVEECMSKLVQLSKRTPDRTDVYHLGLHFFKLTQSKGKR